MKYVVAVVLSLLSTAPAAAGEWTNQVRLGLLENEVPYLYPTDIFFAKLRKGCTNQQDLLLISGCSMQVARVETISSRIRGMVLRNFLHQCDQVCAMTNLFLHYALLTETDALLRRYPHLPLMVLPDT